MGTPPAGGAAMQEPAWQEAVSCLRIFEPLSPTPGFPVTSVKAVVTGTLSSLNTQQTVHQCSGLSAPNDHSDASGASLGLCFFPEENS